VIITRTPLRISFAGGGTDLPSYYRNFGGGAVVSAAIDRYIHVLVNPKFDEAIRVAYSKTEDHARLEDVQHGLVREAMRVAGLKGGIEVHTIADIPSEGTGLGSSSTLTVGLLNAFHAYNGVLKEPAQLAEEACRIEIEMLNGTLGKQDQYAAAFGRVHYFEFHSDDTVRAVPLPLTSTARSELGEHLSLFYTGITRQAQALLKEQEARTSVNRESLDAMKELAESTRDAIVAADWPQLGELMDRGWQIKRGLSAGISTTAIDGAYARARAAGAYGAKITGAGGGGFLLVVHPPERSSQVTEALSPWRRLPVGIAAEGSQILIVRR
jgi:D-glycero-alpha-D-manno-heptose-7-phosphate kinase